MPNGVFFDLAPPNSTRYVLISMVDTVGARRFEGRSHESVRYEVQAIALTTTANASNDVRSAAARIDALLDPQPPLQLTIPGYLIMAAMRDLQESSRIR